MAQPIREAALKPPTADAYPYLPARMWTAAGRLAALVAKYRGIPAESMNHLRIGFSRIRISCSAGVGRRQPRISPEEVDPL
jgi:hypothetical protein